MPRSSPSALALPVLSLCDLTTMRTNKMTTSRLKGATEVTSPRLRCTGLSPVGGEHKAPVTARPRTVTAHDSLRRACPSACRAGTCSLQRSVRFPMQLLPKLFLE